MDNQPNYQTISYVQIGGAGKSGTSLLSSLLDSHPRIAGYPGETSNTGNFFPLLTDPDTDKETKVKRIVKRCYGAAGIYIPYHEVGDRYVELCQGAGDDFWELHYLFTKAFYDITGPEHFRNADLWLDKSPVSHMFAREIFEALPNTRFVHILRDPKDNYASIGGKLLRDRTRKDAERVLWHFRIFSAQSFYYAQKNLAQFGPERYLIMRFEDVCTKPQEEVGRLCDFLGLDMDENVLKPTRAGNPYAGNNRDGLQFDGIYAGNVGRWSERIPDYFAQVMEAQPEEGMAAFGYQPHFSPWQRRLALARHRIRTAGYSRADLLGMWDPRTLKSPAPGVPGL